MRNTFKIFLLFFINLPLWGQQLTIQNTGESTLKIENDKKQVFFIVISEITEDLNNVSILINIPNGFRIITQTSPSTLKKGVPHQFYFAIQNNRFAESGVHAIDINLLNDGKFLASTAIAVELQKFSNLQVIPINQPEYIVESDRTEIEYLVKNTGNSVETIWLKSRNGDVSGNRNFELQSGESKTVKVVTMLPSGSNGKTNLTFDLSAYAGQNTQAYSSNFTVPYLINNKKRNDPYLRFPIRASLLYNQYSYGTETLGLFSFDITGSGHLDHASKHHLDFIARGPNNFKIARFGVTDQYFVKYSNKKLDVSLGDQTFNLSLLTEYSRFARGISVSHKLDKATINAVYLEPRFISSIQREYWLNSTWNLGESASFKTSILRKEHINAAQPLVTDFLNIGFEVDKQKYNLEMEGGLSYTDGKIATAFQSNGVLKLKRLVINSNTIFTDKTYYGFYNNSLLLNNAINYQFSRRFDISISKSINRTNASLDSIYLASAPYSDYNSAILSYRFSDNSRLSVSSVLGEREDRMDAKSYHYKEKLARLTFNTRLKSFQMKVEGDSGDTQDLLFIKDGSNGYNKQYKGRLDLNYKTEKNLALGVFGEYLNTARYAKTTAQTEFIYYGMNLGYSYRDFFKFKLSYRNNYSLEELYTSRDILNGKVKFDFKEHAITLDAFYRKNPFVNNNRNVLFSLKYTLSLNTPVNKKKGLGAIIGQVQGVKTEGVIFNFNGEKVVTNNKGEFKINDLEAGKYNLSLDKSSLGFENAIDVKWPLVVEVLKDTTKRLVMNAIKTGYISGAIVFKEGNANRTQNFNNVLVEVYNDNFSKFTTTNQKGEFNFYGLKEEAYSLRIISREIRRYFTIQNPETSLLVKFGEKSEYNFLLADRKKNVRFQEETIRLSGL